LSDSPDREQSIATKPPGHIGIWGDEAGNLDFAATGSKYFIVCSIVTAAGGTIAADLLGLRNGLALDGVELLADGFHATEDAQVVRDQVFALLAGRQVRADASVYRKSRVYDYIRKRTDREDYFYKLAWYLHFRDVLPEVVPSGARPLIVTATLSTRKRRQLHAAAIRDVVQQSVGAIARPHCAHWSAASHPLLQAADYYTWAVGIRAERDDNRSWEIIKHQFPHAPVARFGW
jgi:hypothetical protein